jgi:hypothetical protein
MAKRFIDTKIWDKAWFRKLDTNSKLMWIYILTKCDHAGILDGDWEAASFFIGYNINNFEDLPKEIKEKLISIKKDQYFIPTFIEYQYGQLRSNSRPHLSVIKRLRDKGLNNYLQGVMVNNQTLKDKAKVKDKVKDKEKNMVKRKVNFELEAWKVSKQSKYKDTEGFKNHVEEFIEYWSEPNRPNTKMKCELQETFNIALRMNKWFKNALEWDTKGRGKNERKEMQFTGR